MSADVSHQGGCIRCQTKGTETIAIPQITTRNHQRSSANTTTSASTTLRQSNHLQGNCTYSRTGTWFQSGSVKLIMRTVESVPHKSISSQILLLDRRCAIQSDTTRMTISQSATTETMRLKRLWSSSRVTVNRKFSSGRMPGNSTWRRLTQLCWCIT